MTWPDAPLLGFIKHFRSVTVAIHQHMSEISDLLIDTRLAEKCDKNTSALLDNWVNAMAEDILVSCLICLAIGSHDISNIVCTILSQGETIIIRCIFLIQHIKGKRDKEISVDYCVIRGWYLVRNMWQTYIYFGNMTVIYVIRLQILPYLYLQNGLIFATYR